MRCSSGAAWCGSQRLAARVEDLARGGPEVALRDGSTVMSSHEDYTYHLDPASGELLRAAGAAGGELRQLDTNLRAHNVPHP